MHFQQKQQRIVQTTIAVILLLFSSGLLPAQAQKITGIKDLIDSIQSIVNTDHIPGLMVGIANKDAVLFSGGFGYADISTKRAVDGATLFRMGSITKMFVSLCILKLIQEGKLGLYDELKKVVPELPFKNNWEATDPVRIVQLLEHTAGFDDMKLNRMCSPQKKEYTGKEMMLLQQHSLVCRWKPGERFAYSNPDYVVLGYIIEKISGKPFGTYIAENILQPLGMTRSNFNLFSKFPAVDTKQYVVHGSRTTEVPSVSVIMGPAGSLWSCADDMLKLLQLFLRNGQPIFPDSVIREMETTHSALAAKAGLRSGYALANTNMFLFNNYGWRGHSGLMGTCFSLFAYNRALGAGFVMSSNGNQQNGRIEKLIADYLDQGVAIKKPGDVFTDLTTMTAYLGQYQFESPRNEIGGFKDKLQNTPEIYIDNNALFVRSLMGEQTKLLQTAAFQFAREGANTATIIFTKNEAGKNVMVMDGAYFEQVPAFRVKARFWIDVIAVFLMLSAVPAGLISLIGWLTGRVQKNKWLITVLPMLAVLLLTWAVINLLQVQDESYLLSELTKIDARSLIIFLGTLLFGVLAVVHIILVALAGGQFRNRFVAVYQAITALAICYIAFVLFQNGWIGLRTWAM